MRLTIEPTEPAGNLHREPRVVVETAHDDLTAEEVVEIFIGASCAYGFLRESIVERFRQLADRFDP